MLTTLERFAICSVLAALFALTPALAPHVSADDPVQITIRTTDQGFEPNDIEVEQGSLVELTFVWDHVAYPAEEHIMVLKDYKVETDTINIENRETTVQFIATEPGTFTFKCDLECDLHDFMQAGKVTVVAGGGGAAALTPSTIIVPPAGISVRSGKVSISASLQDDQGLGVSKAELVFLVEQTFGGTTGLAEVALAETDDEGKARIVFEPTHRGDINMTVRFDGGGIYAATDTIIEVPDSRTFASHLTVEPEGLGTLRAWSRGGLVVIILGIWSTFAFALSRVWVASRITGTEEEETSPVN